MTERRFVTEFKPDTILKRVEVMEAIKKGLREIHDGKTTNARDALDRIERRHGIPKKRSKGARRNQYE